MYLSYYGLNHAPFTLNPDPDFLYMSNVHKAALKRMECSLLNQAPFTVLSGDIGMGKTTLIRYLVNSMRYNRQYTVGLVTNTHPSVHDLLKWILYAFDLNFESTNSVKAHQIFHDFLASEYQQNRRVILIVDEAQNLNIDTLEELRLISNINIEKQQILQTFIVGQQNLLQTLQQPELVQFAQRVAYSYHLEPFSREDSHGYIQHRMQTSGAGSQLVFTIHACDLLHHYSQGIPRIINVLCDTALIYGYADEMKQIGPEIIEKVITDKKHEGILPLNNVKPPLNSEVPKEIRSLYDAIEERANQAKMEPTIETKVSPDLNYPNFKNLTPVIYETKVRVPSESRRKNKKTGDQQQIEQETKTLLFNIRPQLTPYVQQLQENSRAALDIFRTSIQTHGQKFQQRYSDFQEHRLSGLKPYFNRWSQLKYDLKPIHGGIASLMVCLSFIATWFFQQPSLETGAIGKTALSDMQKNDRVTAADSAYKNQQQGGLQKVSMQQELIDHSISIVPVNDAANGKIMPVSSVYANQSSGKTVVVKKGDTLKKIIASEFGSYNYNLLQQTLNLNPKIKNMDHIKVGQNITLPLY